MFAIHKLRALFHRGQEKQLVFAVVAAAGNSTRMGENKLLLEIHGIPVLARSLQALEQADSIDGIILVCRSEDMVEYNRLCRIYGLTKVKKIVCGGPTRAHSVLAGVLETGREAAFIAVHDAARPLVRPEQIDAVVEKACETTAAALAVPVIDSIKRVRGGVSVENLDRDSLVAVQTPQVFDRDLLCAALTKATQDNLPITDDCGAVEALGTGVSMVPGSYDNIKITTPEDLLVAEALLAGRSMP